MSLDNSLIMGFKISNRQVTLCNGGRRARQTEERLIKTLLWSSVPHARYKRSRHSDGTFCYNPKSPGTTRQPRLPFIFGINWIFCSFIFFHTARQKTFFRVQMEAGALSVSSSSSQTRSDPATTRIPVRAVKPLLGRNRLGQRPKCGGTNRSSTARPAHLTRQPHVSRHRAQRALLEATHQGPDCTRASCCRARRAEADSGHRPPGARPGQAERAGAGRRRCP